MRILKSSRWMEFGLVLAPLCGVWWIALVNVQEGARQWVVIGGLVAVVMTFIATWFIVQRSDGGYSRPIAAAKEMVAGNLTAKIEIGGSDEQRDLSEVIAALNDRMLKLVSDVRVRSTTVAGTSSQVSRDSDTLRVRSEMQVASLQQTTDAMAELNGIVQRNAAQAKQADDLVTSSSKSASEGGKAMSQVVTTMRSIRESSKKIVDIIGLIDSIAFQTNILALNAAVEAARAGEHGRGFAVVASEVGTLAKRSATAAKEIKALIGESVKTIATGGKLVDDAGATMSAIVASVQSLTGIIQGISNSSNQQLTGIDSVNAKIEEVMRINKSNTHMFADIIKASGTMNEQSVTLLKSISGFNLGIREHGTPEEAHDMVKRAIEYLRAHGREQFIAEINKRASGKFIERDLYIMVLDVNTYRYFAHGVNSRIINYDSRQSKDPSGYAYMTDVVDLARDKGEGWIEYVMNHPTTNESMTKICFVQLVDDMVIGCGAYKI